MAGLCVSTPRPQRVAPDDHAADPSGSDHQQRDPLFALVHSIAEPMAFFGQLTAAELEALKGTNPAWTASPHVRFIHGNPIGRRVLAGRDTEGSGRNVLGRLHRCQYGHGFLPGPCEYTDTPEVALFATLRRCARHPDLWGAEMAVCCVHTEWCRNAETGAGEALCPNCAAAVRIRVRLGALPEGRFTFTPRGC